MFKLISETCGPYPHSAQVKPETVIECEAIGIRERQSHEKVHCREDEDDGKCVKCGGLADVWLVSPDKWEMHSNKCI